MENHILAERVANAIMMDKSFKGYYLIVEGIKDTKLFNKYIDEKNVRIKECFGCEKVKLAFEILTKNGFTNKIGVIDSDFSKILGVKHDIEGIFLTDYHDIEVMIIKTCALEHILTMFSTRSKIEKFEKSSKRPIRETIFSLGKEIGYLKLANKIYDLGLIFKPATSDGNLIKYKDFIDSTNLQFKGHEKLIESIINYSHSKSKNLKDKKEISNRLKEISSKEYELEHIVNGHDLSNIIFLLLKKTLSSNNKMLTDYNSIEDSLVLAYEYNEFKKSDLYNGIKSFQDKHGLNLFR